LVKIKWNGTAISNDLETTKTTLGSTRTELNSTKFAVADLASKFNGKIEIKLFTYYFHEEI
jgi:hypothetical protein